MAETVSRLRKSLMTHMWRFQQSQAIYGAIFWALALAGILYNRAQGAFEIVGLSGDPDQQVITKTGILMIMVFAFILVFGFMYDIMFRLWEEQTIVKAERNVYAQYKLETRWMLTHHQMFIPLLKEVNNGEFDDEIRFMERWIGKLLATDPVIDMYYSHIEDWVQSDEVRWKKPSMDSLRTAYREKE